jgi:hypothetical protein
VSDLYFLNILNFFLLSIGIKTHWTGKNLIWTTSFNLLLVRQSSSKGLLEPSPGHSVIERPGYLAVAGKVVGDGDELRTQLLRLAHKHPVLYALLKIHTTVRGVIRPRFCTEEAILDQEKPGLAIAPTGQDFALMMASLE